VSHIHRGALLTIIVTRVAVAQAPQLSATSNVDRLAAISSRSPIRLALSRPLAEGEGELALVVGGMDVTAVSERTDSSIAYRPAALPLPEGDAEVVLYRRSGTRWAEIRRVSVRVAQAVSGNAGVFSESATLGNKGQVAEGRSVGVPAPVRRTFQDFVLNAGLRSTGENAGWTLTTQSNYVGVTRRQEALGFAAHGNDAPLLDLSDYSVGLRSGSTALSVGSVNFGTSRHLANSFAARGSTLNVTEGSTTFTLGAMSGSPQTGWSDFSGLERPTDRVFGAALGREMIEAHPGSLRLDVTLLDGSKQPRTSFTQGAVVDAERSTGGSVQLTAALPNQRARITSGYTRSRFENPAADPQLLGGGDTTPKRPQPATRDARFVEGSAVVLQNLATPFGGPANLTLGFRDERVDPLFRSVAAQAQADHQQDGADATLSLGAISGQVSTNWTRDNLGRVQSVLTTRGNATTASVAVPVAAVGGARFQKYASLLPMLSFTFNMTRQAADGTPTNGAFRPTDLPDQVNSAGDATATWQAGTTRLSLHVNAANQDNRQPTRENADFDSGVFGASIGRALGTRGDVSLDLGNEYQTARERDETTRTRRATMNGSFRPRATLNVLAAFSLTAVRAPAGTTSVNTEQHLELSQGFNLWPTPASEPQRGQLFVRFARTGSLAPSLAATGVVAPAALNRAQWTVATGLNLRLF
jgi:hypothetical protein